MGEVTRVRTSLVQKWIERPRYSRKFWAVGAAFLGSLGYLLFQGGKLALMLFVIMLILSVYLLLGQWSGIKRTQGTRVLHTAEGATTLEAGSTLGVKVQLQIPGFWPIPYVFVKDRLYHKNGRELTFEATLVPDWRRRADWEYRTPAMRRGHYTFGRTECVTEDIFGLFEHRGELELPQTISVLPQTIAIRDWQQYHQMVKGANHHSSTTRAVRETTQINGVREYIYGDRISRIHWNATAKTARGSRRSSSANRCRKLISFWTGISAFTASRTNSSLRFLSPPRCFNMARSEGWRLVSYPRAKTAHTSSRAKDSISISLCCGI